MKDVLKSALGTIVGLVALNIILGIFFFLFLVIAGASASDTKDQKQYGRKKSFDHQVLHLSFMNVNDRTETGFDGMSFVDPESFGKKKLGLTDYLNLIESAKDNDRIKGIYLDLNYIWSSWANMEELRDALIDFKTSEKFIYAYGDLINKKAYWLASVSDKIFMTPSGMLEWNGLSANITFYKKALEKLGVEVEVFKYGKYKSAVEPFILEKMSDANREQTSSWLSTIYMKMLDDIASSRGVLSSDLDRLANELAIDDPKKAVEYGLIDGLKFKDEVMGEIQAKVFEKDTSVDFKLVTASKLYKTERLKALSASNLQFKKDEIAVIYASGDIIMGKGKEGIASDVFAKAIKEAREDSSVKAIVLRVNSPGGSALASDIIWRELQLTKGFKPLVVSMGTYAASGGYYIACMADTIVANHNTITGSIGVFGMLPYTERLMSDKLGLTFDQVKTTEYADLGSTSRKITDFERQVIQSGVNRIYEDFVNKVGEGRNMTFDEVHEIAQGRVWTGIQAKEIGLVDVLGGIDTSIEIAKKMAGIENYKITEFPRRKSAPWELIFESFQASIKDEVVGVEMMQLKKEFEKITKWVNMETYQVRIPYDIDVN